VILPALLGGARAPSPPVDVVQSGLSDPGRHVTTSPDSVAPRGMTRDEFASLVTHELRNPLNAMAGWLHLLAADGTSRGDAAQRALAGMRRAVDQQLAQVDLLGRVLRLAGGGAPAAREAIALDGLLLEVADALRGAARAAGREIEADPGEGRGGHAPSVAGDAALLRDALVAIGAFGLRHGTPGAPLRLALAGDEADGDACLRLSIDEGSDGGMSIWNGFADAGARLPLELLHAALAIEAHGGRLAPSGEGRVGDVLEIRFGPAGSGAGGVAPPRRPLA
jgi:K+-sensing histidine kinase KdpD